MLLCLSLLSHSHAFWQESQFGIFSYNAPFIATVTPALLSASGGNITIVGANFASPSAAAGTSVAVSGAPCTLLSQADTLLVCYLPAGPLVGGAQVVMTVSVLSNVATAIVGTCSALSMLHSVR